MIIRMMIMITITITIMMIVDGELMKIFGSLLQNQIQQKVQNKVITTIKIQKVTTHIIHLKDFKDKGQFLVMNIFLNLLPNHLLQMMK